MTRLYGLSKMVVNDLCGVFRKFPDVVEARIFGSRAKGNYTDRSDIDIALTGDRTIPFEELMDINAYIDNLGLLYKVDIVDYAKVSGTPIGEHIDRVGKLFYRRTDMGNFSDKASASKTVE